MFTIGHSLENSIRWMRRMIVMLLITANLMAVVLAEAASAAIIP